jgi:hypothetical protein
MVTVIASRETPHQDLGLMVADTLAEDRMDNLCSEEVVSMAAERIAEDLPDQDLEDPDDVCPDIDDRKSR